MADRDYVVGGEIWKRPDGRARLAFTPGYDDLHRCLVVARVGCHRFDPRDAAAREALDFLSDLLRAPRSGEIENDHLLRVRCMGGAAAGRSGEKSGKCPEAGSALKSPIRHVLLLKNVLNLRKSLEAGPRSYMPLSLKESLFAQSWLNREGPESHRGIRAF